MYSIQTVDIPGSRPQPSNAPSFSKVSEPTASPFVENRSAKATKISTTSTELAEIGEQTLAIAYEMRNPLSVILNGLHSCREMPTTERGRLRLSLALEEAERLQHMVDDIVEFARYRQLADFERRNVELRHLLTEVINLVSQLAIGSDRKIVLTSEFPTVPVMGDRSYLKQVFLTLLVKVCEAAKSTEPVTCRLEISSTAPQVWVHIHNERKAISLERLRQIARIKQINAAHHSNLGLLRAQQIVEAHLGEFFIQSSAVRGATACVQLPIC